MPAHCMHKVRGFVVASVVLICWNAGVENNLAACNEISALALYDVVQCGSHGMQGPSPNWFAAPPTGAGTIRVAWWQVGFGNNGEASGGDPLGNGFVPGTPGLFIGNDSGLNTGDPNLIGMIDASVVGAPPGSLCFTSRAGWWRSGFDGCPDNDRDGALGPFGHPVNDRILNPYFYSGLGGRFPTPNFDYYVDAPMGVLLTESNELDFALAFFSNPPRNMNQFDSFPGWFDMQFIVNGDPNPVTGLNNIVPWQPVPQPDIAAVFSDPADASSPRIVTFSWNPVRIVDDASTRGGNATLLPPGRGGTGARDQGPLVHHVVETAPIIDEDGACATFVPDPATLVSAPVTTTMTTVPADTCVRLVTQFGVLPLQTTVNQTNAGLGLLGDLGYNVVSRTTLIGSTLSAQSVTLHAVTRVGRYLNVTFSSSSELNVSSFEVVGIRPNGREVTVGSTDCMSCSTGLGASYEVSFLKSALRGARRIVVVMQPSGARSNVMDVPSRPAPGTRPAHRRGGR